MPTVRTRSTNTLGHGNIATTSRCLQARADSSSGLKLWRYLCQKYCRCNLPARQSLPTGAVRAGSRGRPVVLHDDAPSFFGLDLIGDEVPLPGFFADMRDHAPDLGLQLG